MPLASGASPQYVPVIGFGKDNITAEIYEGTGTLSSVTRDAGGRITSYVENEVSKIVTYDANGRVSSISGGGVTDSVTYVTDTDYIATVTRSLS